MLFPQFGGCSHVGWCKSTGMMTVAKRPIAACRPSVTSMAAWRVDAALFGLSLQRNLQAVSTSLRPQRLLRLQPRRPPRRQHAGGQPHHHRHHLGAHGVGPRRAHRQRRHQDIEHDGDQPAH